ncbi:uncharacterized protein [Lepeophtheirus salmonis]|uniref:uncharacterized protein isoform X2 n=1 Tax=Lepeophtheirus salmonis TaxID=72036 RepID=UPI003AF39757
MALMIRDGQSLAEASATLFKDILLGSENNDTYNKHIILQDSPNRIKRSSDYPLLPPASSMFEEIPAHLFKHQKSADLKIYCHSDQKLIHHNNFLRSNSPLSSLWTNWDDISNNKGEKVICGVPGLATSIYMKRSKLKSLESNKEEWPNLWKKVKFNLPKDEKEQIYSYCCCCCCCYMYDCCWRFQNPLSSLPIPSLPPNTIVENNNHYQSPQPRDGDYSYAYDSSVSPAFLIKWSEQENYSQSTHSHCSSSCINRKENLYEEIVDVHEQIRKFNYTKRHQFIVEKGYSHIFESNSDSEIGNLIFPSASLDTKKAFLESWLGCVNIE